MIERSAISATFTIERRLKASPARVFAAYASLEAKSAWVKAPAEIETAARRGLPRDRRIVLCCRSGLRAHRAARALQAQGFADLALLAAG